MHLRILLAARAVHGGFIRAISSHSCNEGSCFQRVHNNYSPSQKKHGHRWWAIFCTWVVLVRNMWLFWLGWNTVGGAVWRTMDKKALNSHISIDGWLVEVTFPEVITSDRWHYPSSHAPRKSSDCLLHRLPVGFWGANSDFMMCSCFSWVRALLWMVRESVLHSDTNACNSSHRPCFWTLLCKQSYSFTIAISNWTQTQCVSLSFVAGQSEDL